MERPGFGDWGSELPNDEFAMALAVLGMIGAAGERLIVGDPPEIAERLLRTLKSEAAPLACRYIVGPNEYLQRMGYTYANVSRGPLAARTLSNACRELRLALTTQPRFEVTVESVSAGTGDRQSGGWLLDQLRRPALNAASVYLSTQQKVRTVDWQWPIRIGTLNQKAAALHSAAASHHDAVKTLTVPVDMAIERGAVDVLLIVDTVRNALTTIGDFPYPIHAHAVVAINERETNLDWLDAEAARARIIALTQAEAVLFTTHQQPEDWLNNLIRRLSHNLSFDVAVAGSGGALRPITNGPLLWCSRALIRDSQISNFADGLIERGVDDIPSERTLLFTDDTARRLELPEGPLGAEFVLARLSDRVRQIGFKFESDGATLTSNVNRALQHARSGKNVKKEPVSRSSGPFASTPPAPRHLQVSVMARGRSGPVKAFVAETMHTVDVHIGPPGDDGLFLEGIFPEPASPPSGRGGHLLTVIFFEPQLTREPQLQTLLLPGSGPSLPCRFAVFVAAGITEIEARITVLHENRILQTGVLRGPVAGRDTDRETPKRFEFVVPLVVQRAESDLDCRGRFDGAVVLNHLGDRPGVLGTAGNRASYLWLDDVTVQASKADIERALDTGDWDFAEYDGLHAKGTTKLLRTLALKGHMIHEFLVDQLPAPIRNAGRLQVVMAKAGARFPLEFLYERNPPALDAPVCPHAAEGLRTGACPALCDALTQVPAPFVCPLGFWGLNRVLEWHAFSPELSLQLQGAAARLDIDAVVPSDKVPLDGSRLFGYSKEIDKADADCIPNFKLRMSTMPNPPVTVESWPEWKAAVQQRDPGLLMLLVHTKIDADGTALEMGPPSATASEQDTLLRTIYITEEYVRHGIAGAPIMLLLGCTTAKAKLPFDSVASAFKYLGHAGIIVATSNLIYGPKAVEIAETFLQALSRVKDGERFGDVMLEIPAYGARQWHGNGALPVSVWGRRLEADQTLRGRMFAIEMLPAKDGDCLWIEYGSRDKPYRLLIDGGPIGTAAALRQRIEQITPVEERRFELLIVTHVDSDHIAGILKLLQEPPAGFHVEQVWFNAYQQLSAGILGAKEGEFLSVHFDREERKRSGYWNGSFQGKAVQIPENGPLPTLTLVGDLKLTVLAPNARALVKLRRDWATVVNEYFEPGDLVAAKAALERDRRYRPGYLGAIDITALADSPFEEDTSPANGSSIVVLTEYGTHRCLFAADATPSALVSALRRLPDAQTGRITLSAVKVPHHGSMNNNSSELYRLIDCPNYLVSTNGDRHCHPHAEAIARIVEASRRPPHLYFNYRLPFNDIWSEQAGRGNSRYTSHFPKNDDEGLRVELDDGCGDSEAGGADPLTVSDDGGSDI